jgi:hypothetical protein
MARWLFWTHPEGWKERKVRGEGVGRAKISARRWVNHLMACPRAGFEPYGVYVPFRACFFGENRLPE